MRSSGYCGVLMAVKKIVDVGFVGNWREQPALIARHEKMKSANPRHVETVHKFSTGLIQYVCRDCGITWYDRVVV